MKKKSAQKKTRQQPAEATTWIAFLAAYENGDLGAMVNSARATARTMILETGIEDVMGDPLAALAGELDPSVQVDKAGNVEMLWEKHCAHVHAAFALGFALGELVSPDVFKIAGAK